MDPHAVSRHVADMFMRTHPLEMRQGGLFNSFIPLLNRMLAPDNLPVDIPAPHAPNLRSYKAYIDSDIMTLQHARSVNTTVNQCQMNGTTLCANIHIQSCPVVFNTRTGLWDRVNNESVTRIIEVPVMCGSIFAPSDCDGVSGIFVYGGQEKYYGMHFDDAPNKMITSVRLSTTGVDKAVIDVMYVSRPLHEPCQIWAKNKESISCTRNFLVILAPHSGLFVTWKCHSSSEVLQIPLLVFVGAILLRFKNRLITSDDVHKLFRHMDTTQPLVNNMLNMAVISISRTRKEFASMADTCFGAATDPHLFTRRFLPHTVMIGSFCEPFTKLGHIKRMATHAIQLALGKASSYDKNHLSNKRVRTADMEIATRVRRLLHTRDTDKRLNFAPYIFSNKSTYGELSWKSATELHQSYLNKVQKTSAIKNTKNTSKRPEQRLLHYSEIGRLCGSDTPSSEDVGNVYSMALGAFVSPDTDPQTIIGHLQPYILPAAPEAEVTAHHHVILVNDIPIGYCRDAYEVAEFVRSRIRKMRVVQGDHLHFPFASISAHVERDFHWPFQPNLLYPAVLVRTDAGRFYRGLFVLANLAQFDPLDSFYTLFMKNVVDFVDTDEELSDDVRLCSRLWAADPSTHTHAELHPGLLTGALTSLIPYQNRNHGTKNANMCNHFKAVLHTNNLGYAKDFFPSIAYTGFGMQIPITKSAGFDWLNMGLRPHGNNVLLAIATYRGFNQEDACVVKRSYLERGGFAAVVMSSRGKTSEMNNIERVQFPDIGKSVESPSTPFLMRVSYIDKKRKVVKDIKADHKESGVVDCTYTNPPLHTKPQVRFSRFDEARMGDKFCTPHAQKGTIGCLVEEPDMPYTDEGVTPDFLLNPHAIPSRMTTAQVVELVSGLLGAHKGEVQTKYAFDEEPLEVLEQELRAHGLHSAGMVHLNDPVTGERIPSQIYMGVGYYMRLKHLVDEKVRSQDLYGVNVNPNTRQSQSGRKNDGGLRLGEYERWALIAHGCAGTVHEYWNRLCDKGAVTVDNQTGFICKESCTGSFGTQTVVPLNYATEKMANIFLANYTGIKMKTSDPNAEEPEFDGCLL